MTKLMECADAVAAVLNATAWTSPAWSGVTAERVWAPKHNLASISKTRVFVVPRETAEIPLTRGHFSERTTVYVTLALKKDQMSNAQVDPAMQLLSEIRAHFHGQQLVGVDNTACVEANITGPDEEHLQQVNQFLAAVTLVFQVLP